jgi:hypothetical protein
VPPIPTRAESGEATTGPSSFVVQARRNRRAERAVIDVEATAFVSCVSCP